MFWALNGATETPCRASHRHTPATRALLPASDPVPATSSAPRMGRTVVAGCLVSSRGVPVGAHKAYEGGPKMLLMLLLLLVVLVLFGAGFALHLLWWVA